MIDLATEWFEIKQFKDKQSITIASIVEQTWLQWYPWPMEITYDQGSEFIGHEFQTMIQEDYGIQTKPCTVQNSQANLVLERIHQVLSEQIRMYELEKYYLNEDDPWAGILSATFFAIHSTYHTTLKAMPGQLVFG